MGAMIRSGDKTVADYAVQTLIENKGSIMNTARQIGITARALYKWLDEPRAHKSLAVGFQKHAQGRGSFPSKLSAADVETVFRMRSDGKTMESIAEKFEVTTSAISLILSRKRRAKASTKHAAAE